MDASSGHANPPPKAASGPKLLVAVSRVSVSTQRQAASALLFLYHHVLGVPVDVPEGVARPARPRRLPTVLPRAEVRAVLEEVRGPSHLVCGLLYGAGLRLMEALSIRVQDLSFDRREILVRDGKRPRPGPCSPSCSFSSSASSGRSATSS